MTDRLFEPDVVQCPFPRYQELQQECPVVAAADDVYLVLGYDECVEVLGDTVTYSSKTGPGLRQTPAPAAKAVMKSGHKLVRTLLTNDPPEHTYYRRIVAKAFSARSVAAMGAGVSELIDRLLDDLAQRGTADFVEVVAQPLPLLVIADFLGVPADDLDTFKRWSDDAAEVLGGTMSEERQVEVTTSLVELLAYFADRTDERRVAPGGDFLSTLLAADQGRLSLEEIIAIAYVVLVAGNETTVNLLTSLMLILLEDPELMERVRADRSLVPTVVEEALRLQAPVQGFPRVATVDTIVGGVEVPAGAQVMVMVGAANRDQRHFPDPDSVSVNGDAGPAHLTFGKGAHFCVGAALSRLEAGLALNALLDRFETIKLAEPDFQPVYADNAILRSLLRLPVHVA